MMNTWSTKLRIFLITALVATSCAAGKAIAQDSHFIRQVHQSTGIQWDMSVPESGSRQSALPILLGGSRFELWSVDSTALKSYLLDVQFADVNLPKSNIRIVTEDPYQKVTRTRADRPFSVVVNTSGILSALGLPLPVGVVAVYRHVQAYGSGEKILGLNLGGLNFNPDQGILISVGTISGNGTHTLHYPITAIPGEDRSKVMGEERFSVLTLPDLGNPAAPLAMKFVQIWPVADGAIAGIDDGDQLVGVLPDLVFTAHDLYPDSQMYAQVYEGPVRDGVDGTILEGSGVVINHQVPQNRQIHLSQWDDAITKAGEWTVELLTKTPFGIDRLDHVTFRAIRELTVRGSLSSAE